MSRPSIQLNDYVSLAVMLLMVVALVAGQAGASAGVHDEAMSVSPVAVEGSRPRVDFDGHLSDKVLKVSIAIVKDLSHFRGEDE